MVSTSKGDKTEKRNFIAVVPPEVSERIFSYIAGPRAALSGYSLPELQFMSENRKNWSLLKSMPVFTEDGVMPVNYARFYRLFRLAAEAMDLYIDDERFAETKTKRYVTFHMLRHEYVYRRMEYAQTFPTDQREIEYDDIICYMAWKNWRMLEWYSHHFRLKNSFDAVQSYIKARTIPTERLAAAHLARDWNPDVQAHVNNVRQLVDEL